MPKVAFQQIDVFTSRPFGGNQLAVFLDADALFPAEMQTLAKEMNFAESTFVLKPELPSTDARIRIFTPTLEMPMAGHPTVGTALVLRTSAASPATTQPCISTSARLRSSSTTPGPG